MLDKMLLRNIMMKIKFTLGEPRWSIIKIIGEDKKGTNEIYEELQKSEYTMSRSTLYYHLSSLVNEGIIEMAEYREESGGAPEKLWKLKIKKIVIDLLTGKIIME